MCCWCGLRRLEWDRCTAGAALKVRRWETRVMRPSSLPLLLVSRLLKCSVLTYQTCGSRCWRHLINSITDTFWIQHITMSGFSGVLTECCRSALLPSNHLRQLHSHQQVHWNLCSVFSPICSVITSFSLFLGSLPKEFCDAFICHVLLSVLILLVVPKIMNTFQFWCQVFLSIFAESQSTLGAYSFVSHNEFLLM